MNLRIYKQEYKNTAKFFIERMSQIKKEKFFFFNFSCLYSNEKANFIFMVRFFCFLEFIKKDHFLEKNKSSFFSLLKFRKEMNLFFSSYGKSDVKFKNTFFGKKNFKSFNSFVLSPINKNIFFSNHILKQFFTQKIIFSHFFFLKKTFYFKIKGGCGKFCLLITDSKSATEFYKQKLFRIKFKNIQKLDLLSKSFSNLKNLTGLISIHRNLLGIKTNTFFLSLGFLKVDSLLKVHAKNVFLLNFLQNNRQKIFFYIFEPILFSLIRFDSKKGFFFSKIKSFPFEILPSKARIPIKVCLKLKKNLFSYKNPIEKNKFSDAIKKTSSLNFKKFNYNQKFSEDEKNASWNSMKEFFFVNLLKEKRSEFSITFFFLKKAEDFFNEEFGIIHLSQFDKIFREDQLDIWVNPILIQSLNFNTGYMEIIPNSISIHDLKKNYLKKKKDKKFSTKKSQKFIESLVGYSLFCFFLQVKDRHNANILLNPHNRLIHIDFGFIMGENPGNLSFEASNFKFSKEFILEIGGKRKEGYELFKDLFLRGFFSIRKNFAKLFRTSRKLLFNNIEIYSKKNKLGKFQKRINISKKDNFLIKFIISFIEESAESWKTYQYDRYQLHASGIN